MERNLYSIGHSNHPLESSSSAEIYKSEGGRDAEPIRARSTQSSQSGEIRQKRRGGDI